MALSNAITGQGTIFRRNGTALVEINSVEIGGTSKEEIEVTRLTDVDGYRQFIPGLKDPGTVSINMNYTKAEYITLKADYDSYATVAYEIELPDGLVFELNGYISELPISIALAEKISMDITIRLTGPITTREASSSI